MRVRSAAMCALLACAILPRAAHAQTADARARASQSFNEARSAFQRKDYAAAAAAFEQAATLAPHPATWLNAAEAWQDAGDWVRAASDCDRALVLRDVAPELSAEAEARLAKSRMHIATLDLQGDRAITASIDGAEAHSLPQLNRVAPGRHDIAIVELTNGHSRHEVVVLDVGETRRIDLAATPTPTTPEKKIDETSSGPGAPALVALGVAGFFFAGGAVFGAVTLSDKSSFDDAPSQNALDHFQRDRAICDVALGGAVVAAAVGTILWIMHPSEKSWTTPKP